MLLIPAIDIKQGRCVRLYQGKYDKETVYATDPVAVARDFEARGAKRLHVVDLDGAVIDSSRNFTIIKNICKNVKIPVECGGGIRNVETAEKFLIAGVSEIILGTIIIQNPEIAKYIITVCGQSKIQIGLDFSGEKIAVKGWKKLISRSITDEINFWKNQGIQRFILTDINRDGTMDGPNIQAFKFIAEKTNIKITAAGGVSQTDDIMQLMELEPLGVDRVISGKAVYENKIKIEDFS